MAAIGAATKALSDLLTTGAQLTQLKAMGEVYTGFDFNILLLGHCLMIARWTKGLHGKNHLLNFVLGYLFAFGGGIASAFLLSPAPKAVSPLAYNNVAAIWAFCWWITNHGPFSLADKALDFKPVAALATACVQVLRAALIADRIDISDNRYPGVVAMAIVAGALAGAGGKIVTDFVSLAVGISRSAWEVVSPTYALRSALVASGLYYVTVVHLGALTALEGKALITTLFLAQSLAADLLNKDLDYTHAFLDGFNFVARLPSTLSAKRPARSTSRPSRARAPSTPRSASGDEGQAKRTPRRRARS